MLLGGPSTICCDNPSHMPITEVSNLYEYLETTERMLIPIAETVMQSECDGVLENDLYRLLALLDIVKQRLKRTPCQGEFVS